MARASKRYTVDKTTGTPRYDAAYPHHPPCGVRIFTDGQTPESTSGWLNDAIAVPTLAIYTSWLHILLALFIASFVWRPAAITLALLFATTLVPARPLGWRAFLQSELLACWRRYFHFSFYFEEDLDDATDFIFAQFPHGAFPLGQMLGGSSMACEFPDYKIYSMAATSVFFTPLWRHIIGWMGGVPATRKHFRRLVAMSAAQGTAAKSSAPSVTGTAAAAGAVTAGAAAALGAVGGTAAGVAEAGATAAAKVMAAEAAAGAAAAAAAAGSGAAGTGNMPDDAAVSGAAVGLDSDEAAEEANADMASADMASADVASGASLDLPQQAAGAADGGAASAAEQAVDGDGAAADAALLDKHTGVRQRLGKARPMEPEQRSGQQQQNNEQRQEHKQRQDQHQQAVTAGGSSRQGSGIGVVVGGIAEMFVLSPHHDAIYLRNRKGFVALAVEAGMDIVPVYSFGNSSLLSYRAPEWLAAACRRLGVSAGLIYGRWGLIIPRKLPVMFVLGRIVRVGGALARDDPGFSARVQEVHGRVVDEVVRLYDAHKAKFGWADRPLVVL